MPKLQHLLTEDNKNSFHYIIGSCTYSVCFFEIITTMAIRLAHCSTTAHIALDLRSLIWGFGESCAIIPSITSEL